MFAYVLYDLAVVELCMRRKGFILADIPLFCCIWHPVCLCSHNECEITSFSLLLKLTTNNRRLLWPNCRELNSCLLFKSNFARRRFHVSGTNHFPFSLPGFLWQFGWKKRNHHLPGITYSMSESVRLMYYKERQSEGDESELITAG